MDRRSEDRSAEHRGEAVPTRPRARLAGIVCAQISRRYSVDFTKKQHNEATSSKKEAEAPSDPIEASPVSYITTIRQCVAAGEAVNESLNDLRLSSLSPRSRT